MKKISAVLAVFVSVVMLTYTISAADPLAVRYENYKCASGEIDVYLNTNGDTISDDQLSISLSGQPLDVISCETVAEAAEPVSWLFAIDISGSMKANKIALLKSALTSLASKLNDGDNAAFMTIGNEPQFSGFMSSKEDILNYVNDIKTLNEDTNLYKALVYGVKTLRTDANAHMKRVMVVFSDGEDDIVEGYTKDEADREVSGASIPIYTIAMLNANPSSDAVEYAKTLSSFARESAGGIGQTLKLNNDSEEVVKTIDDSVAAGVVTKLSLSGISLPQDQGLLDIHLTQAGQNAQTSVTVNTAEIRAFIPESIPEPTTVVTDEPIPSSKAPATAEPTATMTEAPVQTEEPPAKNEPQYGFQPLILIIPAAVIALLAIFVIVFILRRKRSKTTVVTDYISSELPPTVAVNDNYAIPETTGKARWHFELIQLGLKEKNRYAVDIVNELVIGRTQGQITINSDSRLSSKHCRIYEKNNKFYIEDCGSANGTYYNGVRINKPQPIERDGILMIGSMELRIIWNEINL